MSQTHPPRYLSRERLLAPDALARTMGHARPLHIVKREAIAGGLSGARIERLVVSAATAADAGTAPASASLILKQLDPRTNWLMRASGDSACREVQFTQSPLWERLPPEIWMPALACALAADGTAALLMPDLAAELFTEKDCFAPADMALAERMLDRLAALHASCWEAAELRTSPWLAAPADTLLAITPARLGAVARDDPLAADAAEASYPARALSLWSRLPELIGARAAGAIQRVVDEPERIVAALAAAPATLAHGDCWLANLGEHDGRLILLDWGLCTAGPATLDSLCLAGTWRALDPDAILVSHRAALLRRGVAAVADDALWELLCDLGWVRATLMDLEGLVWDVVSPESPVPHAAALGQLQRWCARAVEILERRAW